MDERGRYGPWDPAECGEVGNKGSKQPVKMSFSNPNVYSILLHIMREEMDDIPQHPLPGNTAVGQSLPRGYHKKSLSIAVPLFLEVGEFKVTGSLSTVGMGTAARGGRVSADMAWRGSVVSASFALSVGTFVDGNNVGSGGRNTRRLGGPTTSFHAQQRPHHSPAWYVLNS